MNADQRRSDNPNTTALKIGNLGLLMFALAGSAYGWGARGHTVINRMAVQSLPEDGPVFLKANEEWIAQRARIPDTWRLPTEPFLKIIEDPNHHWYKEEFAFLKPIPRSRYEFVLAVYDEYLKIKDKDPERAKLTNVHWTGTLPYAAVETYERLKSGMRIYREQKTAGQNTAYTELDLAFYMGWLGHYIGDGAQPLHDSINSDGWKLAANPKGYTTSPSIHGRFETAYVDLLAVTVDDMRPMIRPAQMIADPFEAVLGHLDRSATHMEEVFQLDKEGAFKDSTNSAAKKLVLTQLAAASQLLRDLVYTAWIQSAKPQPQRSRATEPTSPSNPRYNPATGSAPAAKN